MPDDKPKQAEIGFSRLCDMVDWLTGSTTSQSNAPKTFDEYEAAYKFMTRLGLKQQVKQ